MFFYIETNKQREISHEEIEKHLCTFVNNQQDDLVDKLHKTKFAANKNDFASTKFFLFFTLCSFYQRKNFAIIDSQILQSNKRLIRKRL